MYMVYTSSASISNSGNQEYFTNKKSKIQKLNLNKVNDSNNYNNFLVYQFNEQHSQTISYSQTISNEENDIKKILEKQRKM